MKAFHITHKLLTLLVALVLIGTAIPVSTAHGATNTITLKPIADATVNASSPTKNFGKVKALNVNGSPVIRSYMRFKVARLKGAKVTNVRLHMFAPHGSASGIFVSTVNDNTWSETRINYKNTPAVGTRLASIGKYPDGRWIDMDVSRAVTGEGSFNFVLNTTYDTTTAVASREAGTNTPQLILTLSSSVNPLNLPAPRAASAQSGGVKPLGVPGTWNLKFSDDFNNGKLDLSKWEPNWLAGNATTITKPINGEESSCYDPAQVGVGAFGGTSGALKMSAVSRSCRASNGTTYNSASGMVTTSGKYTFTYGYMEARVWLDGTSSTKNWPAFWADGTGSWPTTGEIDVMEGLGGRPAWHFHWGLSSSPQQVGGAPSMSSKVGWHTFGANWAPGSIKFYYDGVLAGQTTQGVTRSPMYLILNLGVSQSISPPVQLPSDFLVDYVRVWQH